mgnify:CR=1 FL=1
MEKPKRDKKGLWKKGQSGNPKGRPKFSVAQEFRENPQIEGLMEKLINIANTIGEKNEHPQAVACAKEVIARAYPTLKSQELRVEAEVSKGFVYLPPKKEVEIEEK